MGIKDRCNILLGQVIDEKMTYDQALYLLRSNNIPEIMIDDNAEFLHILFERDFNKN